MQFGHIISFQPSEFDFKIHILYIGGMVTI